MKDQLIVDVHPTVYNNVLIYVVQVIHQHHTGGFFTRTGYNFVASNGFKLSSQSCPALYSTNYSTRRVLPPLSIKGNRINGAWSHDHDMMCVRGSDRTRHRTRMYTDSIVYIERLKLAVTEYNEFMRGD